MTTKSDFMSALRQRTLLCDGAMGTQLMARGLTSGECGEKWNLDRPADIEAIHRAYSEAGCDLVTTNTFGGTSATLERHGLAGQVAELNEAGARLARRAVESLPGRTHWVLGDMGPFGGFLEPVGDMSVVDLQRMFAQQAQALHRGGADAIIIETMVDPGELAVAVRAAREVAGWPIIATYAFNKIAGDAGGSSGFRTIMGTDVAAAVNAAIDAGADVVGANCGTSLSLEDYLRLAEALVQAAGGTPVIVQPNAGSPVMVDGKLHHPASPADMAGFVPRLQQIGVRIIGGCCGTSPAHLRAMAATLRR